MWTARPMWTASSRRFGPCATGSPVRWTRWADSSRMCAPACSRQRAPIGLSGGCWLDVVSQPATQPSVVVNQLLRQHILLKGAGNVHRSSYHLRRRVLEDHGVFLPDIGADGFLRVAHARPLTALHACLHVALSRLPVSFLPEVVGVHYAFHAIGVDDLLGGTRPLLDETAVRGVLAEYLTVSQRSADGPTVRRRLLAAVRLVAAPGDRARQHADRARRVAQRAVPRRPGGRDRGAARAVRRAPARRRAGRWPPPDRHVRRPRPRRRRVPASAARLATHQGPARRRLPAPRCAAVRWPDVRRLRSA